MPKVTDAQVLEALRTVIDPDHAADIVSLGMVSGLTVRDNNVFFAIEVPPSRGAAAEPVRAAAAAAVDRVPGVVSVTAVLTAHRDSPGGAAPGAPGAPGGGRGRRQGPGALPGIGAVVAVASGKGGVGKSTTAANLALALRVNGLKVGLLDADIYGPSVPRLFAITDRPVADGEKLRPVECQGLKVMSMGFLVEEDMPMIWRGPMVQTALQQMLRDVAWAEIDVLVVDLPPGTGDAQLTMAQQVPLAGAVIVSTPQDLALIDARKGLNMFRRVDVPVLGIIENMSYYQCPACGHRAEVFGHGGARAEAERLDLPFLGAVPLDIEIRVTSDAGLPIVAAQPDSAHAQVYREIARTVWDRLGGGGAAGRRPPRIVIE